MVALKQQMSQASPMGHRELYEHLHVDHTGACWCYRVRGPSPELTQIPSDLVRAAQVEGNHPQARLFVKGTWGPSKATSLGS